MKTKGLSGLKEQLYEFEHNITESITAELQRINRTVLFSEFDFVPFGSEVSDYVDAIKLDEENRLLCEVSFSDIKDKYLESFISDNEITGWDLIDLLELLINTSK